MNNVCNSPHYKDKWRHNEDGKFDEDELHRSILQSVLSPDLHIHTHRRPWDIHPQIPIKKLRNSRTTILENNQKANWELTCNVWHAPGSSLKAYRGSSTLHKWLAHHRIGAQHSLCDDASLAAHHQAPCIRYHRPRGHRHWCNFDSYSNNSINENGTLLR